MHINKKSSEKKVLPCWANLTHWQGIHQSTSEQQNIKQPQQLRVLSFSKKSQHKIRTRFQRLNKQQNFIETNKLIVFTQGVHTRHHLIIYFKRCQSPTRAETIRPSRQSRLRHHQLNSTTRNITNFTICLQQSSHIAYSMALRLRLAFSDCNESRIQICLPLYYEKDPSVGKMPYRHYAFLYFSAPTSIHLLNTSKVPK